MADDGVIEISENDLAKESPLRNKASSVETLVDIEKGIFVNIGIPTSENGKAILVPDNPHVFIADELRVRDQSHKEEVVLKDVVVAMAHGVRDSRDRWKFTNNQGVVDTVNAYNKYAEREITSCGVFSCV